MSVETIDLRDLCKELSDLRDRKSDEDSPLDDDEKERLEVLEAFESSFKSNVGDLDTHSEDEPTAVRDYCFKEYAQEFGGRIGPYQV